MSAERANARMDVDEFIAWAIDRPGRYELEDGRVLAMAPERAVDAVMTRAIIIDSEGFK